MTLGAHLSIAASVTTVVCSTLAAVAAGQTPGVDPGARALLEGMPAAYAALEAVHAKVKWSARYEGGIGAEDFPLPGPDEFELRVQRPNRLFLSASARRGRRTHAYQVVSDGTTLWFWRSATNTWVERSTGANVADIARLLPDDAIGTFDGSTWEADSIIEWEMLVGGAASLSTVMPPGLAISLEAPARAGGAGVDVIRLRSPADSSLAIEVDLLLSADTHLVRGYRLSTRGRHPDTGRAFSAVMEATYELLETQPKWTDESFRFTPPKGARREG